MLIALIVALALVVVVSVYFFGFVGEKKMMMKKAFKSGAFNYRESEQIVFRASQF